MYTKNYKKRICVTIKYYKEIKIEFRNVKLILVYLIVFM